MKQKTLTLLFLRKQDQILLAMKKRGFGEGRWNGIGGKVEADESIESALVRESQEEIGVTPTTFEKVADIRFDEFFKGERTLMHVHVFSCDAWVGEPTESEEMTPKWFDTTALPYEDMWSDDIHWLPEVLAGKKISADFVLNERDESISHSLIEVESFSPPSLAQLKSQVATYTPGQKVQEELRKKEVHFIAIAGPVGVGKTTITTMVTEIEPEIQPINTKTSRPRKESDPAGFVTATEGVTQQSLTDEIVSHEVVNYDVIVETGVIYATEPSGFTSNYSIGPIMATNIEAFSTIGLAQYTPVYIVAPVKMWSAFITESLGERSDRIAQRMHESIASLEYAQQHPDTFQYIESSAVEGGIESAAKAIAAIAFNQPVKTVPKEQAQKMIAAMLSYAKSLVA